MIRSRGLKRIITSALATLTSILSFVPGAGEVVNFLTWVIGLLGGVALGHASLAETIGQNKLASLASALSVIVLVLHSIPAAAPYAAWVLYAAGVLGIPVTVKKLGKA